jgi:hypothetical protein
MLNISRYENFEQQKERNLTGVSLEGLVLLSQDQQGFSQLLQKS